MEEKKRISFSGLGAVSLVLLARADDGALLFFGILGTGVWIGLLANKLFSK